LTDRLPEPPTFGEPLPIALRNGAVLEFLALRRSASAGVLRAPAPDADQLNDLLRLAARVPDHGKLAPWRFILLEGEAKARFAQGVEAIAEGWSDADKRKAALFKLKTPQIAAQAMGFGANWITDWYAFDPKVDALLGLTEGEKIAGYMHIGTAEEPPQERVRPDVASITTRWAG